MGLKLILDLAANLTLKDLSAQDRTLVEGLVTGYNELENNKIESMEKLAELCDPYALVHEGFFYNE